MEDDLCVMKNQIIKEVTADVISKINEMIDKIIDEKLNKIIDEKLNKITDEKVKQTIQSSTELALIHSDKIRDMSNELALTVTTMEQNVYTNVINKINEEIVPKVNTMAEWVNYNMQDGNDLVDQYRRAAEKQTNKIDPEMGLLTYGKTDKRIISPHVRTFFENDSSSEEYL